MFLLSTAGFHPGATGYQPSIRLVKPQGCNGNGVTGMTFSLKINPQIYFPSTELLNISKTREMDICNIVFQFCVHSSAWQTVQLPLLVNRWAVRQGGNISITYASVSLWRCFDVTQGLAVILPFDVPAPLSLGPCVTSLVVPVWLGLPCLASGLWNQTRKKKMYICTYLSFCLFKLQLCRWMYQYHWRISIVGKENE